MQCVFSLSNSVGRGWVKGEGRWKGEEGIKGIMRGGRRGQETREGNKGGGREM